MRRRLPWALLCAALTAVAWTAGRAADAGAAKPTAEIVANARGVFDMAKNPRPYAVCLILDQDGNRYPSFWCGANEGGEVTFNGRMDFLDESIQLGHKGAFTLLITNAAHKKGMEAIVPGGVWVDGLRDRKFRIAVERITDAKYLGLVPIRMATGHGMTVANNLVRFQVAIAGTVSVGDRRSPFAGTAMLGFMDGTPAFTLEAEFAFPGEALGLPGETGRGIKATLHASSAPSAKMPEALDGDGGGIKLLDL